MVRSSPRDYLLATKFEVEPLRPPPQKARGEKMKKEILKGFTMLMFIVALALATAAVSNAQSSNQKIIADVPFEFVVGAQSMPAGEYAARAATAQDNTLMIQSADGKRAAIRLTNPIRSNRERSNARLVFHRYGEQYFLAEVWSGADSEGRQLLRSRQERASERELPLAQRTYETIEVVAVLR